MGVPQPGLTWGLKRSFVAYVSRLRDGGCGAKDGGSVVDGSFFHFEPVEAVAAVGDPAQGTAVRPVAAQPDGPVPQPADSAVPSTGDDVLRFRGDVRLVGHAGLLFVMLKDPWVEFTSGGAVLTVVDVEHWPDTSMRMPLATLEPTEPVTGQGLRVWSDVPARLTEQGVELFNEQYPAGQPFDPVTFAVPAG
ncbi:HtaA domain-containing protein [Prauserella alba]|uniref:Htaa domain-containing protein n=1 Tax=Prauserella alba TaxID=176898 RepID=A0ABP4FUU7_9PSEU|nr:HtaA domain-containing protein [Prauserella alba]MCP2181809.1 Htaa protein [Prauserella alba]